MTTGHLIEAVYALGAAGLGGWLVWAGRQIGEREQRSLIDSIDPALPEWRVIAAIAGVLWPVLLLLLLAQHSRRD